MAKVTITDSCCLLVTVGTLQFTADGQAKLADFGVARIKRRMDGSTCLTKTQTGSVVGTPWYCAPEVMAKEERAQRWSDVWSMCATLVEWFSLSELWKKIHRNANMTIWCYLDKEEIPHGLEKVKDDRVREILSLGLTYDKRQRPSAENLNRRMEELTNEG